MDAPHEVLGVEADADEETVERAYRRRIKEAHPDHGGSPHEFLRVRAAYERLLDGDLPREEATDGDAATADSEPGEQSRVEFLNYEALADHGWDIGDPDLFEKAAEADLDPADYGRFLVEPDESLLQAAENRGFTWPFACRGGACANCAVAVAEGEMSVPGDHILPEGMIDDGIRLSCLSTPVSEEVKVIYNVKHLPGLDELRLPPHRFERARSDD